MSNTCETCKNDKCWYAGKRNPFMAAGACSSNPDNKKPEYKPRSGYQSVDDEDDNDTLTSPWGP